MSSKKTFPADRLNGEAVLTGVIPERHIHEECGVFGIYTKTSGDVASLAYYALYALQHRGQESAGIVVNDDGLFTAYRDVGLVSEVFPAEQLAALGTGSIAVGHVRYGTTGSDNRRNVQPILVNHYKGRMALAHNGTLTNSHELRSELESKGSIFHTTTDSEGKETVGEVKKTPDSLYVDGQKIDLVGKELTYYVFPVYAIDAPTAEEITATDILYHLYGSKLTASSLEVLGEEY